MAASERRPIRWALAGILALLAFVGAIGSAVGYWSHNVLFDTEKWVETVGPIGTDPVVTEALADYTAGQLNEFLDPTGRLTSILPERLAPLGALAGGAIENIINQDTAEFFQSELYDNLWNGLNETAHTAIVGIVRDQVPFLSTDEGLVTVDLIPVLTPIVDGVVTRTQEIGRSVPEFVLDRVEFDDALGELIAQFETEGLPSHLSEVVIWESERLAAVQQTVALFDRLVIILPILTLLLAAGSVLVAPRRQLMIPVLLLGAALAWWLSILITDLVIANILSGITSENAAEIAEALLEGVTAGLDDLLTILLLIGGVAGVAALVIGRESEPSS
jgi:hypothetical protein